MAEHASAIPPLAAHPRVGRQGTRSHRRYVPFDCVPRVGDRREAGPKWQRTVGGAPGPIVIELYAPPGLGTWGLGIVDHAHDAIIPLGVERAISTIAAPVGQGRVGSPAPSTRPDPLGGLPYRGRDA